MDKATASDFETLLTGVKGVVRDAIHQTLGTHFRAQTGAVQENVEDLAGEVMLLLVRRVRELPAGIPAEPIQNFPGYARTVASNVCYAYLRRRYPAWTRLKNQVRYVTTHDPQIELRYLQGGPVFELKDDADVPAGGDPHKLPLRDLIKMTLRNFGRPVELNDLVDSIAEVRGIRDDGPAAAALVADLGDIADTRLTQPLDEASYLKEVWDQVRQLPIRQRVALLLNLRDYSGRGVLALFPITGTASIREIAEAIEMPAEELAGMWNILPMDDLRIAERLGITRQQVINLRKSARARLARRMVIRPVISHREKES